MWNDCNVQRNDSMKGNGNEDRKGTTWNLFLYLDTRFSDNLNDYVIHERIGEG